MGAASSTRTYSPSGSLLTTVSVLPDTHLSVSEDVSTLEASVPRVIFSSANVTAELFLASIPVRVRVAPLSSLPATDCLLNLTVVS